MYTFKRLSMFLFNLIRLIKCRNILVDDFPQFEF